MIYISRQDSTLLKGILTVLIIIGHNHIIAPHNSPLMGYLYTFHVACFFILPWLYDNKKEFSLKNISDTFFKNMIPYLFFFIFSFTVYTILENKQTNIIGVIVAFITGSQKLLKENVGFFFLWFLPTFCSFSMLKHASDNYKWIKYLIVILSLITIFLPWEESERLKNNLPLGIFVAVKFFINGLIVASLLKWKEWAKYIGAVFFLYLSVLYLNGSISHYGIIFMPITGFLFIFSILPILRMKWLRIIGEYSLPIYLTHVYIYNAIELVVPNSILWGIIALVLTVTMSYIVSLFFYKIKLIRGIIFPRNIKEWKEAFKCIG